ncbi:putative Glycosyltransferase [Giardia muris]|uniref:Putative Glycosyltransferase n=1 Tax=Giardia muris TaxID=5742 RepID=A0A4Z1T2P0_GIAMU|nr:putative Glycosyltransferase [Giardia muris]|eukprot:TNJ27317.1 putative Glycosyltransferase [Giardia muris]
MDGLARLRKLQAETMEETRIDDIIVATSQVRHVDDVSIAPRLPPKRRDAHPRASTTRGSTTTHNTEADTPSAGSISTTQRKEPVVSTAVVGTSVTLAPTALPPQTGGQLGSGAPTPFRPTSAGTTPFINNLSIASTYKQAMGINDELLYTVLEKLKHKFVDLDVRKVQTTAFMNVINSNVTDYHKAAFGPDLMSAWSHYLWLALWGFLIGTSFALLIVFGGIKIFFGVMTILFYIFIVLEYVLMFAALKLGQYSPLPTPTVETEDGHKGFLQVTPGKIALIIPLGWGIRGLNAEQKNRKRQAKLDVLTNTIAGALNVFHPTDIFILHNSSDQELPDPVVMECCAGRAVYVPLAIGSKSCSAYYGAILSNWLGYEFCLIMDDDTILPRELAAVLGGELSCDAYAIAIAAAYNETEGSTETLSKTSKMIVGLQDIEYKLSDLSKLTQYNYTSTSSVLAPHGAINIWKTSLLNRIMAEHNGIFHGEDYQMGLAMRKLFPNMRLGFISSAIVNTVAPTTWKDLYTQRATSWDLAAQQFLWGGFCASPKSGFYGQVICCLPCSIDNFYLRVITLEDVWTVIQDYFRYPFTLYQIILSIVIRSFNWVIFIMYMIVFVAQWIIATSLEYIKFRPRPDLQVPRESRLAAVLMFPVYRFLFSFVRVNALFRFFFKFESIKRGAISIKEMNLPAPKELPLLYPGLTPHDHVEVAGSGVIHTRKELDEGLIRDIINIALREQKTPRTKDFAAATARIAQKSVSENRLNLNRHLPGAPSAPMSTCGLEEKASTTEYLRRLGTVRTPSSVGTGVRPSSKFPSARVEAGEPPATGGVDW